MVYHHAGENKGQMQGEWSQLFNINRLLWPNSMNFIITPTVYINNNKARCHLKLLPRDETVLFFLNAEQDEMLRERNERHNYL